MFNDIIANVAAGAISGKMTQGMGAVQISFDKPKYAPGETVSAKARFMLDKPKKASGFQVTVTGSQEREKYSNDKLKDKKSEKILSSSFYARNEQIPSPEDKKGFVELPAGNHELVFQFQLPIAQQPPAPEEKKGMFGKSIEKWVYRSPTFTISGILLSMGMSTIQGEAKLLVDWPYCEVKAQEWDSESSTRGDGWDQDKAADEGGWDQDTSSQEGGTPAKEDPAGGWD